MRAFADTILTWFDENGRELPWRRDRQAYGIWLCEIIMQQTRIAQGTAYWERFMRTYPRVEDLAAASEDDVLRLWEGLGYYSRARNLHAAARQIVQMGAFPETLEGIKSLKGVGDYTAAAIGSIAFGLPAAVVDGNVYRVLSRYFGIETPVGTTAAKKEFSDLAQRLLPADRPGDFNEGMMDFGAMVCTPSSPDCTRCPLLQTCFAYQNARVESLPVKKAAAAVKERFFTYIYIRCQGRTAIRRRPSGDIWQGLWEPFLIEHAAPASAQAAASPLTPASAPAPAAGQEASAPLPDWAASAVLLRPHVRHQLTHRTLYADFYLLETAAPPPLPADYRWVDEAALDRYAKPRLVEMLLESLAAGYASCIF